LPIKEPEEDNERLNRRAAVIIQKLCRGFLVRLEWRQRRPGQLDEAGEPDEETKELQRKAAVAVEKICRGWLARREMRKFQANAKKLNQAFGFNSGSREEGESRDASVKIQKVWRGFNTRKQIKSDSEPAEKDPVVEIQKEEDSRVEN
jgi:hypothetical protein